MSEFWEAIIKGMQRYQIIYDNVEKARGGFYMDTIENRKKGRVGQRYGPYKGFFNNDEYISKSIDNLQEFSELMLEVKKETNLILSKIGVKSKERIKEKSNNEYRGDVTKVKDIIRCTLIYTNNRNDDLVEGSLKKKFKLVEKKVQLSSKFDGYSGTIYRVKFSNGCYGEIQYNHAAMIYLKESKEDILKYYYSEDLWSSIDRISSVKSGLGHKMYEQIRVLEKKVKSKSISREEISLLDRIKVLHSKYYSEFNNLLKNLK